MVNAGDILFASLETERQELSFIATVALPAGKEIIFTRQRLELTPFGTTEFCIGRGGYLVWQAPAGGLAAGTVEP